MVEFFPWWAGACSGPRTSTLSRESTQPKKLSEEEIDELVIAEADNDAAWEAPVKVEPATHSSLSLPRGLAARATSSRKKNP